MNPCFSTFGGGAFIADREGTVNYYLTSGHYSTLRWQLGPGTYDASFVVTALAPDMIDTFPGPYQEAGLAAVRVDAVPEPASVLLVRPGWRRRRRGDAVGAPNRANPRRFDSELDRPLHLWGFA